LPLGLTATEDGRQIRERLVGCEKLRSPVERQEAHGYPALLCFFESRFERASLNEKGRPRTP
jgi:hypothetical protein